MNEAGRKQRDHLMQRECTLDSAILAFGNFSVLLSLLFTCIFLPYTMLRWDDARVQ